MVQDRIEDIVDATRRTRLASERTYLAWWRTALATFAVSLGIGKIVPQLAGGGSTLGYQVVGVGYAVLGVAFIVYGFRRQLLLEVALEDGRFVPFGRIAALAFSAAGVVLGLATAVVVIA